MSVWVILFIVMSVISLAIPFITISDREINGIGEVGDRSGTGRIRAILLNMEQLDLDLATGKLARDDHGQLKTQLRQEIARIDPERVWETGERDGAFS
jgi:hypothetical protein